jgi:hypothetical protein
MMDQAATAIRHRLQHDLARLRADNNRREAEFGNIESNAIDAMVVMRAKGLHQEADWLSAALAFAKGSALLAREALTLLAERGETHLLQDNTPPDKSPGPA